MLPLHDDIPTRNFPTLTVGIISLNVLIYLWGLTIQPDDMNMVYYQFGMIPNTITDSPWKGTPTVITAMFLHGGFMHLAGNMLYLWIFGNNLEDALGKYRFILFYFVCGAIAAFSHAFSNLDSDIPMVGASGAIAGVLGGYMVLFPHAKVKTLVFLGFFVTVIRIPAVILLLIWMGLQVFNTLNMSADGSGVAWLAHIGGFIAGMVLIMPFRDKV
jgi:membrane associated rhomboid family serine protease